MTCGVYKLTQPVTGEVYVGSSCDIQRRWKEHASELARDAHINVRLQSSYRKHGPLLQKVLIVCREQDLLLYEQLAMDALSPRLNMSLVASFTEMAVRDSRSEEGRARRRKNALRLHAEGRLGGDSKEMSRRSKKRKEYPELMRAQAERMTVLNASRTPEERSAVARKGRASQPADLHVGMKRSEQARANMRAAWVLRKEKQK